jgi:beta-lactamase superfamily II metal-dependent hydrolase
MKRKSSTPQAPRQAKPRVLTPEEQFAAERDAKLKEVNLLQPYIPEGGWQEIFDSADANDNLFEYPAYLAAKRAYNGVVYATKMAALINAEFTYEVTESKDNKLVVMFMKIGSGDCILLKAPTGEVIVVDCGSRKRPDDRKRYLAEITSMLKSALFLNGQKGLHALVLTHSDTDHYVDVPSVLKGLKIKDVYHSGDLANYNDKRSGKRTANRFLAVAGHRNRVSIYDGDDDEVPEEITNVVSNPARGTGTLPYTINATERWVKILDNGGCTVKLLAAEVPNVKDATKVRARYQHGVKLTDEHLVKTTKMKKEGRSFDKGGTNSASIVTLIEVYGRKILLCGDATYATEIFLLDQHRVRIRNVDLAQIEHHGAGSPHAGNEYVETLDPILAAISAGTHGNDYNPRWRVISKYLGLKTSKAARGVRLSAAMDDHHLDYGNDDGWVRNPDDDFWTKSHKKKGLYSTRSNGDLCFLVEPDGTLAREFDRKKTDADSVEKVRYAFDAHNTLTLTVT